MRGVPDRGWEPGDVVIELGRAGIDWDRALVADASHLEELVSSNPESVFWPLNYTFDGDPRSLLLSSVLEAIDAPFLGCNSDATRFTSKLQFTQALAAVGLRTAPKVPIDHPQRGLLSAFPVFVKNEFSCNSEGVLRVDDAECLSLALRAMGQNHPDEQLYVEESYGDSEWTVAVVVVDGHPRTASMRLTPVESTYIDAQAKQRNDLIRFEAPDGTISAVLDHYVELAVAALELDGYFRVDVLLDNGEEPCAIDLNILPFLTGPGPSLSYLPMAFMMAGASYSDVLGAVLASGCRRGSSIRPGSALHEYVHESRFLRHG